MPKPKPTITVDDNLQAFCTQQTPVNLKIIRESLDPNSDTLWFAGVDNWDRFYSLEVLKGITKRRNGTIFKRLYGEFIQPFGWRLPCFTFNENKEGKVTTVSVTAEGIDFRLAPVTFDTFMTVIEEIYNLKE
jgi:hypothetical protein